MVVVVGVRKQGQVVGVFDSGCQLMLVFGFGVGDMVWNDFVGFGNVGFQGVEIFVIDFFYVFGGEVVEFMMMEEMCYVIGFLILVWNYLLVLLLLLLLLLLVFLVLLFGCL